MQVRKGFRDVLSRLLPQDKVVKAMTEYSVYANSEGVFGDQNVMALAGQGENCMDIYQWWLEQGEATLDLFRLSQCLNKPQLCSNQQPHGSACTSAVCCAHS